MNIIRKQKRELSEHHYVVTSKLKDYWTNIVPKKVRFYVKEKQEKFCIIIAGGDNEDDFYAIPYEVLKDKLINDNLSQGNTSRWILTINNKTLYFSGTKGRVKIDVGSYYADKRNISRDLPQDSRNREIAEGQGYECDPKSRKAVENRAIEIAKENYESQGFNVEVIGKPYDLLCTKLDEKKKKIIIHVEVKGTTGNGGKVFLTSNEVEHAKNQKKDGYQCNLMIIGYINLCCEESKVFATNGKIVKQIFNWVPEDGHLKVIQYEYTVPS